MNALIVDIETAGEDWSAIDEQTRQQMTERVQDFHPDLDETAAVSQARTDLGLSPLTGEIIALGALDCQSASGAVYFQAPEQSLKDREADGVKFKVVSEKELLEKFWQLSAKYETFVTFSGRTFDIPYIMIRSAIHEIRPTKDLMRGRYLYQQAGNAIHIDLHDQLKFYGSLMKLGSLHLACRAFGIATPKDGSIDGKMVSDFYRQKKYQEIAEYNARDLLATRELYLKWQKYLAF
jgi:DNA polymerase elongation subunit (family B)